MSNDNTLINSSGGTEGNLIHSPFSPSDSTKILNTMDNSMTTGIISPLTKLHLSAPPLSPSSSPLRQSLPSPYSPIRCSHINPMREKYLYSPYKCSSPKSVISSPKRYLEGAAFGIKHNDHMPFEKSSTSLRRRSYSLSYFNHSVADHPLSNSRMNTYSRQRRSQSLDLSLLEDHSIFPLARPFALTVEYQNEFHHLSFSGQTLDDLKNAINSCFSSLPVVRVCIEHPSIPNHLVNITDVEQLYDNAVIHLQTLDK